jgi:hypothetical protein
MAFGISYVDIELLIRLSQNQTAESEPVLISPDAEIPTVAEILTLPETSSISDSFSAKNSETNIVAAVTENIPPVSLTANSGTEKSAKSQAEETDKVADIVFNLTSQTNGSGIKKSPVDSTPAANNFSGTQPLKQSRMDAEIVFRSLLERFRTAVVYDYEASDALQLEEDAARTHKPFENFGRRFADSNENRAATNRKKAIRDQENLKREALRKTAARVENQSSEDEIRESKKRELLKKIREANKFL